MEDGIFVFHCEVDAFPEAIISWSLSGRVLIGNTQFVTIDNQTLMIHPPLSNGIGGEEVTCNVGNFLGNDTYAISIVADISSCPTGKHYFAIIVCGLLPQNTHLTPPKLYLSFVLHFHTLALSTSIYNARTLHTNNQEFSSSSFLKLPSIKKYTYQYYFPTQRHTLQHISSVTDSA